VSKSIEELDRARDNDGCGFKKYAKRRMEM
jgi:hypothetical protein